MSDLQNVPHNILLQIERACLSHLRWEYNVQRCLAVVELSDTVFLHASASFGIQAFTRKRKYFCENKESIARFLRLEQQRHSSDFGDIETAINVLELGDDY